MIRGWLAAVVVLAPMSAAAQPMQHPCAATLVELRSLADDARFPLVWEETGMADGKPLRVAISESQGALFMLFIKTGEGVWAESSGQVCKAGANLEARFSAAQIRLGPAAHWALRAALAGGGRFTLTRLASGRLRIATPGWSGTFIASALGG